MGQGGSTKEGSEGGEAKSQAPQTETVGSTAAESRKVIDSEAPPAAVKETEAAGEATAQASVEAPAEAPAEAPGPSPVAAGVAAEGKADNKSKKEGQSKGTEGKGNKETKGKDGKAKGKDGKASGKDSKDSKDSKSKNVKGKDGKGKGNQKGVIKGSGPTAGGSGYRLNVKNLGKMTEVELKKLFEPFGDVSMVEVKMNEKGESRGFGFVVLPGEKEGEAATNEMNGKEVNGTKLNVAAAERRATPEDEIKGKGKDKGKGGYDVYAAQAMYAQQWAAYSQIMYMQQYAAIQQQSFWANRGATMSQEFEGSLKSMSSRNGYGFIVCRETYELFGGRDVYIDQSLLPEGTARGTRLLFTVNGNEKGHPKAVSCRLAPQV